MTKSAVLCEKVVKSKDQDQYVHHWYIPVVATDKSRVDRKTVASQMVVFPNT